MDGRFRRDREISPDRAKVCTQPRVKAIKRVQVVYYLTRNGQLEHPHYMEVTHFVNQPLRLKDVMDQLTVLRGKGMPSLYSWSYKRSYKNGYVWNDLADNDIICPTDGAEFVLKGSELIEGCSERLQQLHVSNKKHLIQEPNCHSKSKQLTLNRHRDRHEADITKYEEQEYCGEEEEEEEEEEYEDEEKTSYTSSTTPHSRCSRGVSTDELEEIRQETATHHNQQPQEPLKNPTESTHYNSSPLLPSQSSILVSHKTNQIKNTSTRFEDGDPVKPEPAPSRNSVLLHLISCGNLAIAKAKNVPSDAIKQTVNNVVKRSNNNKDLHRGVLCKGAIKVAEEEDMINLMSENPRFGNLQAEEKEYFSGSIVESMSEDRVVTQPVLKKSNSYNEERLVICSTNYTNI
ncbi:DUF966 domain-containing protein [Cephalotus follicularis]|uniref:DUF966 domain-containing protein n=1 Tax=Cephalotus follicularis TaxID=3775 RepID=A0A1Q3D6I0_CEPFO|nr:DUF966 domain-containing protein [Cephalotus follicularis]GAV88065.1 DUF966 domain-containing protein [Cephalotus follicularis]